MFGPPFPWWTSRRTMRNSNLLKWANPNNKQGSKNGGTRQWIHSAEALQKGHVAYLVKYLGFTDVDEPKGIEVVKEGIRKLTFNQQLKKSEGSKIPKVELTISIDGVAIQEPKTKRIMNQYPLHRISYCADDKGEKKFFSFIAKEQDGDQHVCFVFVSDKLAEEITLTIGQAFDLAYRRFLETSGKDLETHRNIVLLQQKMKRIEFENSVLRHRLNQVAKLVDRRNLEDWMSKERVADLVTVDAEMPSTKSSIVSSEVPSLISQDFMSDTSSSTSSFMPSSYGNGSSPPPVPPRAFEPSNISHDLLSDSPQPSVGTKLQGLLLDDMDEDDFNPRATETSPISHLHSNNNINNINNNNLFNGTSGQSFHNSLAALSAAAPPATINSARPRPHASNAVTNGHAEAFLPLRGASLSQSPSKTKPPSADLFGMEDFSSTSSKATPVSPGYELENALGFLDKRILEMKDGFSRGLTVGNEDFSLESLDPLRN